MDDSNRNSARWPLLAAGALVCTVLGGVVGMTWQTRQDPVAAPQRKAIEQVVQAYLLEHPEVLPQAMERLRAREQQKQLAGIGNAIETPFPGAVLGNPRGRVVLVEFSDYACTFCRRSVADVEALIAENPDLKVVMREFPILSPASTEAARWALAAAEQGKFAGFHRAMFAAGRPDQRTIASAAASAGLDIPRAQRIIADPRIEAELRRNAQYARQLELEGTPGWLIGDQVLFGAVGKDNLARAIAESVR